MADRGRHLAPRLRRISRTWVIPLTLVMSLVLGGVAWADNVQNDVVVGGNDTFTMGGSTRVNYKIAANNGDGQRGCNAEDDSKATVTISTPAGVTANPGSLDFTSCDTDQAVVFSATVAGNHEITVSVSDSGTGTYNTNPAKFTLNVLAPSDNTPPVITPSVLGTLGTNGWYITDVAVSWTVVDNESAISSSSGCGPTTINSDTGGTMLTCTATSAGGTSSESVTIKRDATAPTITGWSNGPQDGHGYYFGSVPAEPTCTASDSGSGLTAAECVVSGYGTTLGSHTLVASATDNAGNEGNVSRTYTVLAWTLNGFYQPVDMDKVNTVKGGSTVPLKFEVFAGSTELTDVSVVDAFTVKKVSCTALNGEPIDDVELTTTGGTVLRYDWSAGQFIQNWQTPKGAGLCYSVTMTTDDGSHIGPAYFKTK